MAALYASERSSGMSSRRSRLLDAPERRSVAVDDFELRADGDKLLFTGYAAVFETAYDVFGGPPRGWSEIVDRRAFDVTLKEKPDTHLLSNHEGLPLARTKSGTLRLSTDRRGLRSAADLDRRDPDVQRLVVKMERGDLDQMSIGFRTKADEWNDDETERRLTEVSLHRGDVSVVNFGASPTTTAQIRGLEPVLDVLANLDASEAVMELRALDVDVRGQLVHAQNVLSRVLRELSPRDKRRLSVKDAIAEMARV